MDKRLAAPAVTETATLAPAVRPTTSATAPAAADKSDANRLALVKKVEVPATGNEVEDANTYGFRLWDAKLYQEAEAQLKQVVTKWPQRHWGRQAQQLVGRAYHD